MLLVRDWVELQRQFNDRPTHPVLRPHPSRPTRSLPAAALTSTAATAAPSSAATALDVQCMLQAGGLSDICNAAGMEVAVVADLVMGRTPVLTTETVSALTPDRLRG